jgi:crotonyl-CoA carboxylase/reductase
MRQKRVQGLHFAHLKQAAAASQLVIDRRIDPVWRRSFAWHKIPLAHREMWRMNMRPAIGRRWSVLLRRVYGVLKKRADALNKGNGQPSDAG